MDDRTAVVEAIRAGWSSDTIAEGEFASTNPARGQCDASSFVAWRYLGGDLVLSKVFLNGEEVEHHYWNRIDGDDLDITRDQFTQGEDIVEIKVHTHDFLAENMNAMRPELLSRIELLSSRVESTLGAPANYP
ncbi:MAG: YunG family protein [Acidimicrobiia bacterium]